MESCKVVLIFDSVDEILRREHLNEILFGSPFTWYYFFSIILQILTLASQSGSEKLKQTARTSF